MITLTLLGNIVTIIVTIAPCIAILGKWLDVRSTKRQVANNKLTKQTLYGIETIGELTLANTESIEIGGISPRTAIAKKGYLDFRESNAQYKNDHIAGTTRT